MDRAQARDIINHLEPSQFAAIAALLESFVEPLSVSLAKAPVDDELLSPLAIAGIEEGREQLARGEWVSHDEVLREFGLEPANP